MDYGGIEKQCLLCTALITQITADYSRLQRCMRILKTVQMLEQKKSEFKVLESVSQRLVQTWKRWTLIGSTRKEH